MTEKRHDDSPADTGGGESALAEGPPLADGRDAAVASQWRLMWWKFRRHRLAMAGLTVVVILYLIAAFAEFLSPFDPNSYDRKGGFHPPQAVHFIDRTEDGSISIRPYVWGTELKRDPRTLITSYAPSGEKVYLSWFAKGDPYEMWGLFPASRHLLAPADPDKRFYMLGADRLGRDMLSRTIYGARLSLLIGLIGVAFSLVLGIILGGLAGYLGGWVDTIISRTVELVLSLPTIPIWLALAAALPATWSTELRYFFITLIVSLVGWTELARVVRGRFMSLKNDDFVIAAVLDNARPRRVIFRHMLPSLTSHIIASVTLAIPLMILAETALSFLGLGLMPPAISWGVLLKEAQDVRSIVLGPWLFAPGAGVVITVLAFNFLGDGLRDAADPYS